MRLTWKVLGKSGNDMESVIRYVSSDGRFIAESVKRPIPHANGSGTWEHTTYRLTDTETGEREEFYKLCLAKLAAAKILEEEGQK